MSKKVSIGLFTPSLGNGGAEKHLLRIANHLPKRKFNSVIISIRTGGSYEREIQDDVTLRHCIHGISSSTLSMLFSRKPPIRIIRGENCKILFSILSEFHGIAYQSKATTKRESLTANAV